MRAAPLPRCTVTGVTVVVSVPRVLGVPAAQPSVGARLGMGEDIVQVDRCDQGLLFVGCAI